MSAPFSASEYVLLSAQSYYYYRNSGQQPLTTEQIPTLSGWAVNSVYSYTDPVTGFSATVFEKGGQYVVAYRGTDDWREGQGDKDQNDTFAPGYIRYLTDAPGIGEQTLDALSIVQRMVAQGIDIDKISFTGHSLGGGLAGIAGAYFGRPAVMFDPAPIKFQLDVLARFISDRILFLEPNPFGGYPRFDEWMGSTLSELQIRQLLTQRVEDGSVVYRVQGEALDLLDNPDPSYYHVTPGNYIKIDLGDSQLQDSPALSTLWTAITSLMVREDGSGPDNLDPRKLHHISAIVLAVLGYEEQAGIGDVYNTLRDDPSLLHKMIDEELTAIKSYVRDSEENPSQKASHGNFERILILNQSLAADFGLSFRKFDNSTEGVDAQPIVPAAPGGTDNLSNSLLKTGLRDAVTDLGFILARKVADRLNRNNPANVHQAPYDPARTLLGSIAGVTSLLGPDAHSVAIQFKALTTEDEAGHDLTGEQKAKLEIALNRVRNTLAGLFGTANYPKLFELYDAAREAGTDGTLVFGGIANGDSNLTLKSGFGMFLGGDLRDVFKASNEVKDDFFYGGKGNDALYGYKGDDYFDGGDDNDWIEGGEGKDEIYGADGADRLTPGKGIDEVYGGAGNDLLVAEIADGNDTMDGGFNNRPSLGHGDGTDTIVYKYYHGDGVIKILDASEIFSNAMADYGLSISEAARGANGESGGFGEDSLESIERAAVEAGDGADTLIINEDSQGSYILYVDMGAQDANKFDTINIRALTLGATVDLSGNRVKWESPATIFGIQYGSYKYDVTVREAEAALGGKGDDILLAGKLDVPKPFFAEKSDAVTEALGKAPRAAMTDRVYFHGGEGRDTIVMAAGDKSVADGGLGNDSILAGGKGAIAIGGLGKDRIFNQAEMGIIWGDVVNSVRKDDGRRVYFEAGTDAEGKPIQIEKTIADDDTNSDQFWWAPSVRVMDAQKSDYLSFYGLTLTGGGQQSGISTISKANFFAGGGPDVGNTNYFTDHLYSFIGYIYKDGAMYVVNMFEQMARALFQPAADGGVSAAVSEKLRDLSGAMRFDNFTLASSYSGWQQSDLAKKGTLNMVFRRAVPNQGLATQILQIGAIGTALAMKYGLDSMVSMAVTVAAAATRHLEGVQWKQVGDPLVIDLDGDGLETFAIEDGDAYFDIDGDMFREATGWLKGDDGFLVLDSNNNGRVDDISEMFGNRDQGGYAELAAYDSNGDGKISVADAIWSELKIWQDFDEDGETDSGELNSLAALGITELSLSKTALNATTVTGTNLLSYGDVTFDDGRVSSMYEAIFNSNDTVTKYAGESGFAPWQSGSTINAKGLGTITDLAVATANDPGLADLAQARAALMTTPKLRDLVAQAGDVLGEWGMTLETSRELYAVRVSATGELLERTLWDGAALASGWRLEQGWSPTSRASLTGTRTEAPYLMRVENGRAVILDYGIKQADGSWKLASDAATTYATVADIQALAHATGTEWRVEDIQANPLADLPVDEIGVYFINGAVKDYTIRVTDNDGSFYVWARNVDRALQLQAKTGFAYEFNLRNYQVDLATLDEVNSTDDSTYRVEKLTPAQFHFATSLGGIDFRPEMLTASYDNVTGRLSYTVNGVRGAGRYVGQVDANGNPVLVTYSDGTVEQAQVYESDVKTMIALLQPVMEQYIVTSRRFAVRMALQGGLAKLDKLDTETRSRMTANDNQKQVGAGARCAVVLAATSKHAGLAHKLSSLVRSKRALQISPAVRLSSADQKYRGHSHKRSGRPIRPEDTCYSRASGCSSSYAASLPLDGIQLNYKRKFRVNGIAQNDRDFNAVMRV